LLYDCAVRSAKKAIAGVIKNDRNGHVPHGSLVFREV
jgi:hypothetical protein